MAEQPIDAELEEFQESDRRSMQSFFAQPPYPVSFVRYFAAGGVTTIIFCVVMMQIRLREIDRILNDPQALKVGGHLPVYDAFSDITTICLIALSVFIVYCIVIAQIFSHRVAGPTAALVDCIDQMRRGNYGYDRQLREHDELHPIRDALSMLGRELKDKQSKSGAPTGASDGSD